MNKKDLYEIFAGVATSYKIYRKGYGGEKHIFLSPYFLFAALLSLLIVLWGNIGQHEGAWNWISDVTTIVPPILGFSVGGYAILVGFGDESFLNIMRGKKDKHTASLYMKVNASFLHFIIVQFVSIFYTLIIKAFGWGSSRIFSFLGILFFFYAVLTIVSTAFTVLNLADWFDSLIPPDDDNNI